MLQFLLKRFIGLIFVLFGVTFITFTMGYFAPGDPISAMMGDKFNYQTWVTLRHVYGLDQPFQVQYFRFVSNLLHFNLGLSYFFMNRPVWDVLKDGLPVSLELAFWGTLLQIALGVPLGILSAVRANTWVDTSSRVFTLILHSTPNFVIAVLLQLLILQINNVFGLQLPVTQWGTPWHYSWQDLQFKIAPILTFSAVGFAFYARLTRTSMLEMMQQDFTRTARAKGLRENIVVYRHVLRNALIPLVTTFGVVMGFLVLGSFFVESIFNVPGIARITVTSINQRDYPIIQATVILITVCVVIGNLLADLLYTVVDPRIRVQ